MRELRCHLGRAAHERRAVWYRPPSSSASTRASPQCEPRRSQQGIHVTAVYGPLTSAWTTRAATKVGTASAPQSMAAAGRNRAAWCRCNVAWRHLTAWRDEKSYEDAGNKNERAPPAASQAGPLVVPMCRSASPWAHLGRRTGAAALVLPRRPPRSPSGGGGGSRCPDAGMSRRDTCGRPTDPAAAKPSRPPSLCVTVDRALCRLAPVRPWHAPGPRPTQAQWRLI
jgi:hypothetical protein